MTLSIADLGMRKVESFLVWGLSTKELSHVCADLDLPVSGRKIDKVERILEQIATWDDLMDAIGAAGLRSAADFWHIEPQAERAAAFVERTPLRYLEDPPFNEDYELDVAKLQQAVTGSPSPASQISEPSSPPLHQEPLEVTRENIKGVLQAIELRRLTDEVHAHELIFDVLHERFGDSVGRERLVGGYTMTSIDFDIGGLFGIEVKHTPSLFRRLRGHATEIERLIGQVVFYGRQYQRSNIFVVVVGPIEREQQAVFRELKGVIADLGIETIHIPSR